jgi:nicotinamide riboside kinase
MKKIAITGTHGVGKTTLAHQICVTLKERNINSCIIEEKARSCPFPINQKATIDTELWMVHTQFRAELHAKASKYDVAVIDRCSLDAIVYWQDRNTPHAYFELLRATAMQWAQEEYDMLILLEPSSDTDTFAVDAVRDSGIVYRNRIRDLFRVYIDSLPEQAQDRILRIKSDEVFEKHEGYSTAVHKVINHEGYPATAYVPQFV